MMMHHRRAAGGGTTSSSAGIPTGNDVVSSTPSDAGNGFISNGSDSENNHSINNSTSSNGMKKRRRNCKSPSSKGIMKKLLPRRLSLQLRQLLSDEDLIITLIQAVSIIILLGCAITLMMHYFGAGQLSAGDDDGDGDDDDSSSSSNTSWLKSLWNHLNWMVQPSAMVMKRQRMANGLYPRIDLKPSTIYTIPNSLSFVGDKSDHYAKLRKNYDEMLKDTPDVKQKYTFGTMPMNDPKATTQPYDIYNCPYQPPTNYPYDWNLLQLLNHWQPDDPRVPTDMKIYQGLCIFDYEHDYNKALNYRKHEVPFVVVNDPQVKETVKRWNAPGYMEHLLGHVQHRAEYSESNHFLYWNPPRGYKRGQRQKLRNERNERHGRKVQSHGHHGHRDDDHNPLHAHEADDKGLENWKEPTTMMRMTYKDWLVHANLTDGEVVGPNDPHYYYRLIGCGETGPQGECDQGSSEYLFDELPYFQPRETLYIVDPLEQKGIHCRFGMNGVIAENHFDQSRNAIVVLGGERRYVLAHPNQCEYLSLYPKGHPSARHSAVDWSDPDLDSYPEFAEARGNEVVLQAGDVLYLPTNWFHYIISLNLNFQCNTRSGITPEYMRPIRECGF